MAAYRGGDVSDILDTKTTKVGRRVLGWLVEQKWFDERPDPLVTERKSQGDRQELVVVYKFADGIEKTYPASNFDDLMAAVDAAVASGVADPENLFVTGGSGGGILTAWLVGKTDRFRAAAAQKPVINWTTQALTADGVPFFARYWMGKMPWEDPQSYWARSPISLVGNMKTPTLVVVGSEDYRTPVSEAEQLYAALQLKGVPTALVKVPGASHGGIASRPSQSAAKAAAIIAWFDKYRKRPAGVPAAGQ